MFVDSALGGFIDRAGAAMRIGAGSSHRILIMVFQSIAAAPSARTRSVHFACGTIDIGPAAALVPMLAVHLMLLSPCTTAGEGDAFRLYQRARVQRCD
jgi:hypothetical protein